jgi:hypothetical protein
MKARNVAEPTDEQVRFIEAAAPERAPIKAAKKRKVLVWGHVWTHQPNPYAEKALEILARKAGAFEAVISDDPHLLLADRLRQFDALVMNNIHEREPFLPGDFPKLSKEQQAAERQGPCGDPRSDGGFAELARIRPDDRWLLRRAHSPGGNRKTRRSGSPRQRLLRWKTIYDNG